MTKSVLGIIGGSGIYDLPGLENAADGSPHGLLIFFGRTFSRPGRS